MWILYNHEWCHKMHIMCIDSWIFYLSIFCCWCDWVILFNDNNEQCTTVDDCQQRHLNWWYKLSQVSELQLNSSNNTNTFECFLVHTKCHRSQFIDKQHNQLCIRHSTNPSETPCQSSCLHRMHHRKHNSCNDFVRSNTNHCDSNLIDQYTNNHRRWSCTQYRTVYFDFGVWNTRWNL